MSKATKLVPSASEAEERAWRERADSVGQLGWSNAACVVAQSQAKN